ncbi:uncharacterized protein BJ171DRAFT_500581 [Polychytrium aggregatum]|uniref:uncharacterized protein n=1 Tax=Polychytrium aggregatum TaxID=110093 RepID=UPI0022FDB4B1|nr:uncharacterized protein BJ171DRAFT_500581 [Polychytrium aggregatum]KAI9205475.1 hypothetical protein BJ171DRAFT_500581 [Polychytrium aggregatum]
MAYSSHMQIIESGIESSTFDNEKQTIHSVLDESPKSLWSSIGSKTADVDEFLTFRLIQPACIVTRIELIPFKAFYQRGAPVYGPREISVSIGFHTSLKRMHYTSERYQLENEHKVQVINIAPTLVVGEFVRLNLFGRFQKQSDDNLFYSTLQNVKCYGIPLGMCSSLRWISRSLLRLALLLTDERHSEEYRRGAGHNRSNAAVEKVMQRLKTQIQPELAYRAKMIFTRKQHAQKIMMGEWKSVAREIACHNWRHELRSQKYLEWFKKTVQEYFNKREQRTDAASYTTVWGTTINPSDSSGSSSSDHSDLDQPTSATEAPAQSPHVTSPMFILPDSGQAQNPMVFYLDCLHHLGSFLNAYETMEMARISVESKSVHRMSHAFFANRFECTEELGDFFASHQHTPIALSIYSRAHITDKIIELSIQLLYFTTIFEYIRDSHDANYCKQIIRRVRQKIGLVNAVQFSCQLLCLEPQFRNAVVEVFQVASETSHIVELNDLVAWLGNWAMVKEMQVDDQ